MLTIMNSSDSLEDLITFENDDKSDIINLLQQLGNRRNIRCNQSQDNIRFNMICDEYYFSAYHEYVIL
jgi:hypothetical protein